MYINVLCDHFWIKHQHGVVTYHDQVYKLTPLFGPSDSIWSEGSKKLTFGLLEMGRRSRREKLASGPSGYGAKRI